MYGRNFEMTAIQQHACPAFLTSIIDEIGSGPLTEERVVRSLHPLFSRVLQREGIYLANHSLGRPMDQAAVDVAEAMDLWYQDLDGAWGPWLEEMQAFRARTASIIGWPDGRAVVPKTSAGQGLRAVLNALPTTQPNIVATQGEFDSIDFILRSYAAQDRARLTWVKPGSTGLFDSAAITKEITDETDIVVVSLVFYATGQSLTGLDEIITRANECGTLVVLDAYHAAGAVPIESVAADADFMIGGSYKYARGGTGACWLAIHPRHLGADCRLMTLDTGWFARKDPFGFARGESVRRGADGDAWLESTPAILPFYQARSGQQLLLAIGVDRLAAYNDEQQAYLATELDRVGVPTRLIEPRGAFLLVPTEDVKRDCRRLADVGVIADGRPCPSGQGGYIRLCPDVLMTRAEMRSAAEQIGDAIRS